MFWAKLNILKFYIFEGKWSTYYLMFWAKSNIPEVLYSWRKIKTWFIVYGLFNRKECDQNRNQNRTKLIMSDVLYFWRKMKARFLVFRTKLNILEVLYFWREIKTRFIVFEGNKTYRMSCIFEGKYRPDLLFLGQN